MRGNVKGYIHVVKEILIMPSFNRVIVVGNLTRDPELRYVAKHTAVSDVGLAVNDRVKRNDEWVEETVFIDVTLWGRTAEVANEFLTKGSPVLIEGRLKYETWEKDGQKRSKLKLVCEHMRMLGTRENGNGDAAEGTQPEAATSAAAEGETSF